MYTHIPSNPAPLCSLYDLYNSLFLPFFSPPTHHQVMKAPLQQLLLCVLEKQQYTSSSYTVHYMSTQVY